MKAKIKGRKEKDFEPFTIEVTVESKEELISLWHRLNLSCGSINRETDTFRLPLVTGANNNPIILWDAINKEAKKLKEYNHG